MPDIVLAKKEDFPEGLREHAVEKDGKWVVNCQPNAKLVEFRENNIAKSRELEAAQSALVSLKGIVGDDPDRFKSELSELRTTAQKVKDGELKGTSVIEAEVQNRVAAQKAGYDSQLKEAGTKLQAALEKSATWESQYKGARLDQEITNAVMAADSGANPAALPDFLARARQSFRVKDDGTLVRMNGDVVVYSQDGVTPMPPKEWLAGMLKEAPYLAKASAGGGANGGGAGGGNHGMSDSEFQKLSPQERIRLHRQAQRK